MGRGRGQKMISNSALAPRKKTADYTIRIAGQDIIVPGDERGFVHREDESGQNILVFSSRGNFMSAAEWSESERFFRSLMFNRESGEVVSIGFPKFFNYSEDEKDTSLLDKKLRSGAAVQFTEKMDGSLIIRSVVDGKVLLRTRGTTQAGDHGEAAWKVLRAKYPDLKDPEFEPESSMLFEFITPDPELKVVLNYSEEDLVLLDRINHQNLQLDSYANIVDLADSNNLRAVETRDLPTDPEELLASVDVLEQSEGVVARVADDNNSQHLVKIKSADYLLRHRLRFALTSKSVCSICIERDINDLDGFEDYLKESGADWELVEDAKPLVETFIKAKADSAKALQSFDEKVKAAAKKYPDRGDFAREFATKQEAPWNGIAFSLLDDKIEQASEKLLKVNLEKAFASIQKKEALLEEAAE